MKNILSLRNLQEIISIVNSSLKKKKSGIPIELLCIFFKPKIMLVKNPRIEAITFLCICMSLANFGFIHFLRAEHAGRVYSSPHMKIKRAATHLSPNVAAHTREVPLLHQHRHCSGWAQTHESLHTKGCTENTTKRLYLSSARVVCCELFCLGVFERCWSLVGPQWRNNAFNTLMSSHPLPVTTASRRAN